MLKTSFKVMFFSIFGAAVILLAGSCIEPRSLEKFYDDPDVDGVVQRNRIEMVDLTGEHLNAGNGRITDLNAAKYYWVEVSVKEVKTATDPGVGGEGNGDDDGTDDGGGTSDDDGTGGDIVILANQKNISISKAVSAKGTASDTSTKKYHRFVAANGTLTNDPVKANRVPGKTITGLKSYLTKKTITNDDGEEETINVYTTYTIRSAAAAPVNGLEYFIIEKDETLDPSNLPDANTFEQPLPAPDEDTDYFLNISSLLTDKNSDYGIIKRSVTFSDLSPSIIDYSDGFFKLEEKGTVTDYIFIETEIPEDPDNEEIIIKSFMVLNVVISGQTPDKIPDEPIFEVTLELMDGLGGQVIDIKNPDQVKVPQAFIETGFTITLSCDHPEFDSAEIKWRYGDTPLSDSATITISKAENDHYMSGTHIFTVEAKMNTISFTKIITIIVELDV